MEFGLLFLGVLLFLLFRWIIKERVERKEYEESSYYKVTKTPFYVMKNDLGKAGEYTTYVHLHQFESQGAKFLFNLYIPARENQTTEIDILMICKKGLFVIESKNYSGWIFGNENQQYWYQTLPNGRRSCKKNRFYNPIKQNQNHIKHLHRILKYIKVPIFSVVAFSDRCTFKSVHYHDNATRLIHRSMIANTINELTEKINKDILSQRKVDRIYEYLYPYTQADEKTKQDHITAIYQKPNVRHSQTMGNGAIAAISNSKIEQTESVDDVKNITPAKSADENSCLNSVDKNDEQDMPMKEVTLNAQAMNEDNSTNTKK